MSTESIQYVNAADSEYSVSVDDEAADPRSCEVLVVIHRLAGLLEAVDGAPVPDDLDADAADDVVARLEAAFRVGERVLASEAYERGAFREDFDALDEALRTEVRETIVPVADALGFDLRLDATPTRSLEDHLAVDTGWRGS